MMTTRNMRELLQRWPFRPFRLPLTDGACVPVPHPDFAWAHGGYVYVAREEEKPGVPWDNAGCHMIFLMHVARVEMQDWTPVDLGRCTPP